MTGAPTAARMPCSPDVAGMPEKARRDAVSPTPSLIDSYLSQVADHDLRAKIRGEFDAATKQFGLVFERGERDCLRLPATGLEVGRKVVVEADGSFHRIVALDGGEVTVADAFGVERVVPAGGVTVAREVGDVLYPGLVPVAEIRNGAPGDPVHTIINGENFYALEMLQSTHAGLADLIYVDPPYNTGGDRAWNYKDNHVSARGTYRHSAWLSFMESRLLLARNLLSPTGVIVVAVDDNQHHRLRMLMDQIFGSKNFVADVVWADKGSNLSKFTSGGVDYMLVYGRDATRVGAFRDVKRHAPELVAIGAQVAAGTATVVEAREQIRAYLKAHKGDLPAGVSAYTQVDELGRVFCTTNMDNSLDRPNLKYPITDPETGVMYPHPKNGWTVQPSTLLTWLAEGRVSFAGSKPRRKVFLAEALGVLPSPVFTSPRWRGSKHLEAVLGGKRFPFPKDHEVLMRWFKMVAPKDAVILDFFAGSGSTAEAVMRLNVADGGTRQAILVTNNELSAADDSRMRAAGHRPGEAAYEALGVFQHVTRPRLETVVTGVREDGSVYSAGLPANVVFATLNYLDRAEVNSMVEFTSLAGVFWLRAGAVGPLLRVESLEHGFAVSDDGSVAVLFNADRAARLAAWLAAPASPTRAAGTRLFVVATGDKQGEAAAAHFRADVTLERIYGDHLASFRVNTN